MTKTKLFAAAAVLSSLMVSPVLAQSTMQPAGVSSERPHTYHHRAYNNDSGFWPADAAAGIVGGAVGAAGAIATAPFRGDSYAYDNGDSYAYDNGGYDNGGYAYNDNGGYAYNNGWDNQTYAQRNGFVCQPGTLFRGEDGRRHLCQ